MILDEIAAKTKIRVEKAKQKVPAEQMKKLAEAENPDTDIHLYINSPGGVVTAGMAIYDTMQYIKPDVSTICVGSAASMASVLLTAGAKGKRFALPHSQVMIHQPLGGVQGQATEIEIHAREILRMRKELNGILSKHTGQPIDVIQKDTERDNFMTAEEAKKMLVENMKAEARSEAQAYINDTMDEARLNAAKEAKRIVINTIQRTATETAIENAVTTFPIENDEVKGRIIGREGRNIRTLEAATGVEIVVDDTPDAILLSAFDPVRREVARLALHQLVIDGRIHPARIEEVVNKVSKQLEDEILETGKRTCIDLGIHGLNIELVKLIGRMKYRSSYGQNLLQHSREVANICATMASELGLNPKVARRAGLLHDIGKVSENEPEYPHAILGAKLAEQYKERPEICNAIGAHHEEMEMTSIYSPLVLVADAISGARPGARREVIESYIKRLKGMEDLAASYPGVTKSYAIQAGRELRVIVGAEEVTDAQAANLSTEIAQRIQDEMTYPGQVKITVIRETRSVAIAK